MPERKDWDDGARATGTGIAGTKDTDTGNPGILGGADGTQSSPLANTGGAAPTDGAVEDEGRHYRRDGGG